MKMKFAAALLFVAASAQYTDPQARISATLTAHTYCLANAFMSDTLEGPAQGFVVTSVI